MTYLLLVAALFAADLKDWKNLDALKSGDRVGVVQSDMKRVEGSFGGVTDAGVVVDGQTVAKDRVVRVYRKKGMSRLTRTLIGAGIGLAAGAVIAETGGRRSENEGAMFGGIERAAWYAVGIGAGAGVGAVSGSGYETIYRK